MAQALEDEAHDPAAFLEQQAQLDQIVETVGVALTDRIGRLRPLDRAQQGHIVIVQLMLDEVACAGILDQPAAGILDQTDPRHALHCARHLPTSARSWTRCWARSVW